MPDKKEVGDEVFIIVDPVAIKVFDVEEPSLTLAWLLDVLKRNGFHVGSYGELAGRGEVTIVTPEGAMIIIDLARKSRRIILSQYWWLSRCTDKDDIGFWHAVNNANFEASEVKFVVDADYTLCVHSVVHFGDNLSEIEFVAAIERHWIDFLQAMAASNLRQFFIR